MIQTNDEILGILEQELGEKYFNLKRIAQGAQTPIFKGNLGSKKGPEVTLKVDKVKVEGPRAQRYAESGCGTKRHIETLSRLKDAEKHHILGLRDFYDFTDKHGFAVSVHRYVNGITLEERLSSPINESELAGLFADILDAANYWTQNDFLHRDVNPTNIMVENQEASVLDFCNAGSKDGLEPKPLPTAGRRTILDPFTVERFTGQLKPYTQSSEAFAIGGIDLYKSLTGEDLLETDPDSGVLNNANTRESLLTPNGKIDVKKYEKAIDARLRKLTGWKKKYAQLIKRSMTSDENLRYQSIGDLTRDFLKISGLETITRPHRFPGKIARRRVLTAGVAAGALAAVLGLTSLYHGSRVRKLEQEVNKPKRYEVVVDWDDELRVQSNLVDLRPIITSKQRKGSLYEQDNRPKFLQLSPGETITVFPLTYKKPCPEKTNLPRLNGAVYIEGFPGQKFSIWPGEFRPSTTYDDMGGLIAPMIDLTIPNLPAGCYSLAIEVYSPLEKDLDEHEKKADFLKNLKFQAPGRVLARDRIPIVIGNPRNTVALNAFYINGYSNYMAFKNLKDRDIESRLSRLSYEVSMPETGFRQTFESPEGAWQPESKTLFLSNIKHDSSGILKYVVRDNTGIVTYGFFPLATKRITDDVNWWGWDIPDRDFSDKTLNLRRTFYPGLDEDMKLKRY